MSMPQLSVIIPVYNTEQYLERCLNSVLAQNIELIEIIAIDDGSTDGSLEILQEYARLDSRIIVKSIPNGGVANARNVALGLATGTYLAFCDSDDIVPQNAYRHLLNKAADCELDMIVGAYQDVNLEQNKATEISIKKPSNDTFTTVFFCPCLWNKLFQRSLIETHHLRFQPMVVGEDVTFLSQLYPHIKKVAYTTAVVYQHIEYIGMGYLSLNHKYNYPYFQAHILCRENLLHNLTPCAKEAVEHYVFYQMTPFLRDFFNRTYDSEDRTKIFKMMQEFLKRYDWRGQEAFFVSCFGIAPDIYFRISAPDYVGLPTLNSKDKVEKEFQNGIIGFRYILKYAIAWLQYKMKFQKMRN